MEARISNVICATKSAKPFFMTSVVLTWLNGWTTSFRTHSPLKQCIFGCLETDRLLHYITYVPHWSEIYRLNGLSTDISAKRSLALEPAESNRLATATPPSDVINLATAVDTYNSLKALESDVVARIWGVQLKDSYKRIMLMRL